MDWLLNFLLSTYKDPQTAFKLINQFKNEAASFTKTYVEGKGLQQQNKYFGMFGLGDLYGFRAQGSNFWQLFPNPFGIFAFLAENHWAVWCCREEFSREIASDGYYLVGNEKNFEKAKKVCKEFRIDELRLELVDHLKIYGNFWVWPRNNMLGGLKDLKILLPQYLEPRFSPDGQRVVQWIYYVGFVAYIFEVDQLKHCVYRRSMRHYDLGNAPLATLLTDLEADLQASMYNNMVFQKGGLIGMAILMDNNKSTTGIPGANSMALARQMENELRANHSGARAGFDTVVLTGARDIKQMNNLADLDGAFHKTSDKAAKQVAHVMGVPHERLGIITNANQQYHAASLADEAADIFDKAIYQVVKIVDNFINSEILPRAGIKDVQIRARDRFNSFTMNMAKSLVDIGKLDGFMSVDEARTEIAKLPPLGGTAGKKPLRVLPNISVASEILPPATPMKLPVGEEAIIDTPIDQDI